MFRRKKSKGKIIAVLAVSAVIALAVVAIGIYFGVLKPKQYTILLDYGESSGNTASVKVNENEKIENLPSALVVDGKYYLEFAGWYTEKDCGGLKVADEKGTSAFTLDESLKIYTKDNTLKLYAGFTYKRFEVNFFNSDGTKLIRSEEYVYGTSFNNLNGNIMYDNMVVTAWSEERGGNIFTGKIENDIALYALNYSVQIAYNTDGGNELASNTATVGEVFTLPVPVKEYYRFTGWYRNNEYVGTDITVPASNVTLVAHWEKTHYLITLNAENGNAAESTMLKIGNEFTLPTVKKDGYKLDGWYDSLNRKYEGSFIPERDTELFARWVLNTYQVILDAQGGLLSAYSQDVIYDEFYTLPVPTRNGYCFEGWYTEIVGGVQKTNRQGNSLGKWSDSSTATFYARWEELKDYVVNFTRQSCKTDNGYNPAEQGTEKDILAHSTFEFLELSVNNCVKNADGAYHLAQGNRLSLTVNVLKDINKLPTGSHLGSPSWSIHYLNNDTYNGIVYGTDIYLREVGKGAYYVKITYDDGTSDESSKVNFLDAAKQNDVIDLIFNVDTEKTISRVEVVCVYELYYDYMSDIWDWGGTKRYANWRCTATLNFN